MISRNFLLQWALLFGSLSVATTSGAAPTVNDGGIVNNASYTLASPNVAPGAMVAIFGNNLTDGTSCVPAAGCYPTFDSNGRLQTTMSGAQVTVNGNPVPIFYATPQQLGIQIPTDLTGTSATVVVTVAAQSSTPHTIAIDPFSPGIFTFSQDGKGAGAITHADAAGTPVSASNIAQAGEVIIIYATGLGQVTPAVPTGAVPSGTVTTVTTPIVTIDGLLAQLQFSGLSGCCVGLYQINVFVPSNVRMATDIPVVLSIGGKQSNTVTLNTAAKGSVTALSAVPSSINFGDVPVGTSNTQTVTLTNTGSGSVTISQAAVTGTGFSLIGLTLPLTLGVGQSSSFSVQFVPTAATGSVTGGISISSKANNWPNIVLLVGFGSAVGGSGGGGGGSGGSGGSGGGGGGGGGIGADRTSINFGDLAVGGSSPQTLTLTNTGSASVTISQANVTGTGFSLSGLTLPLTLGGGQSSSFSVQFAPTATGSVTGNVTIISSAINSPTAISLSGNGVALQLSASSTSINFGNVAVGGTSTQTLTLTNPGSGSVTISQANMTGTGFSLSGLTLPLTLGGGQSTSFSVQFAPTATGSVTGNGTIISNSSNSQTTISLSGNAVTLLLSASSASINFGNVAVGGSSTQTLTLTNTGSGSVTISQANVTGTGFTISGLTLPLTLGGGQSSSFTVNFAPTTGSSTGSLSIISNAGNSPTTISLSGNGVSLQLSASSTSINFGNVALGASSTQTLTLANIGSASVTISQVNVTGNAFSVSGLTLPLTLQGGQNSSFSVKFAPTGTGNVTGNVTILSTASNSPTTISLIGNVVTFLLSASSPSINFGNVALGGSSTQTLTLTNTGSGSVTISQANVTGTGFSIGGLPLPLTLGGGQSSSFSVNFAPTGAAGVTGNVTILSSASNSPATILLSGAAHSVVLTWAASTSTVAGYNVYRSTTSGAGYSKLNTTLIVGLTYTDTTVLAGQTYYYVVTAVGASNNESAFSSQVQATIPSP